MDREQIREGLEEILATVTENPERAKEFTEKTSLREEVGLDSLQVVEMLFEIEEKFGAKIEDEEAQGLQTIADVLDIVERKLES